MTRTYFTDRDLGKVFPQILKDAGVPVERHADHFAHDTPDGDWLKAVGERGWAVLTHDRRIRYKANERAAIFSAGIPLFVIVGHAPLAELAENFVRTLPRIEAFARRRRPPFIAKVLRPAPAERARRPDAPGQVVLWLSG